MRRTEPSESARSSSGYGGRCTKLVEAQYDPSAGSSSTSAYESTAPTGYSEAQYHGATTAGSGSGQPNPYAYDGGGDMGGYGEGYPSGGASMSNFRHSVSSH